jgi:hypothetical protein
VVCTMKLDRGKAILFLLLIGHEEIGACKVRDC